MTFLAFILFLFVAAACAWIAASVVPGRIPGGFITAAIVGVIGAWIGSSVFGHFGPDVAGVSLLPAILGSAILVFILHLVSRHRARTF